MKFYPLEELEDEFIGKVGTKKRDEYEADIQATLVGDAMKQIRKKKQMTQEHVAMLLGVQRAQVSRIENGKNLTISTIAKYLTVIGEEATIKIGELEVAL